MSIDLSLSGDSSLSGGLLAIHRSCSERTTKLVRSRRVAGDASEVVMDPVCPSKVAESDRGSALMRAKVAAPEMRSLDAGMGTQSDEVANAVTETRSFCSL